MLGRKLAQSVCSRRFVRKPRFNRTPDALDVREIRADCPEDHWFMSNLPRGLYHSGSL